MDIRSHRLVRATALALAAAASLLMAAAPAQAAAPTGDRNVHLVLDFEDFFDCGSFGLDYHLEVTRTIIEYTDGDGDLVKWAAHALYFATFTREGSDVVIIDNGSRHIVDDYRKQQSTIFGGAHHITWPGGGLVFAEVGRLVFDWNGTPDNFDDDVLVQAAGIHQDPQVVEILCSLVD
jgi:hypothetical protein